MQYVSTKEFIIALISVLGVFFSSQTLFAQTAGNLNYNTTSNTFEFYDGSAWVSTDNGGSINTCSTAGQMRYNSTDEKLEFCNGSYWRSMMGSDTTNSCSTAGALDYDSGNSRYQVCSGSTSTWWSAEGDPCVGNPTMGTTCNGGALYAGVFDGGKYMVHPSGCNDSSTPTCDGTVDSLVKTWKGSGGTNVDIPGVENVASITTYSSPSYRGDVNTAAIVAHSSTTSSSAADWCNDLVYGGYSDWYLPSKSEYAFISCHSDIPNPLTTRPDENPDCVDYGGKTTELTGFDNRYYHTSTEIDNDEHYRQLFSSSRQLSAPKYYNEGIRCIRRYDEAGVDEAPDAMDWPNFTGTSASHTVSDVDSVIFFELTASNGTGTPTLEYRINTGTWTAFTAGATTLIAVRDTYTLEFRATGTSGHDATITVKNATDDGTKPTIDTVTATVP